MHPSKQQLENKWLNNAAKLTVSQLMAMLKKVCTVIDIPITPEIQAFRRLLDKGLGFSPTPPFSSITAMKEIDRLLTRWEERVALGSFHSKPKAIKEWERKHPSPPNSPTLSNTNPSPNPPLTPNEEKEEKQNDSESEEDENVARWYNLTYLNSWKGRCRLLFGGIERHCAHMMGKRLRDMKDRRINRKLDNLTKSERKTLKRLWEREDIMVCHSDKTKRPILISVKKYKQFCLDNLEDKNTYRVIGRIEDGLPEHLTPQHIYEQMVPIIDYGVEKSMGAKIKARTRVKNSTISYFYVRIKDHKEKIVGRPIAANYNYVTAEISHLIDKIVQPYLKKVPSIVRGSKDFAQKIDKCRLQEGKDVSLISADVEALYPSMDQDLSIRLLEEFLKKYTKLKPCMIRTVCQLTNIVLKNNLVQFDGIVYLQIKGIAMGTALAVVLAQIYMHMLEAKMLVSPYIQLYLRFIDDVFVVIDKGYEDWFSKEMNSLHPSIKLVCESNRHRANMLDTTVVVNRPRGRLDLVLFTKPIDSKAFLLYGSAHPDHTFRGIVKGAMIRCVVLNSDYSEYWDQKKKLIKALRERAYPMHLIAEEASKVSYDKRETYLHKNMEKAKFEDVEFLKLPLNPAYNIGVLKRETQKLLDYANLLNDAEDGFSKIGTKLVHIYTRNKTLAQTLTRSRFPWKKRGEKLAHPEPREGKERE